MIKIKDQAGVDAGTSTLHAIILLGFREDIRRRSRTITLSGKGRIHTRKSDAPLKQRVT